MAKTAKTKTKAKKPTPLKPFSAFTALKEQFFPDSLTAEEKKQIARRERLKPQKDKVAFE